MHRTKKRKQVYFYFQNLMPQTIENMIKRLVFNLRTEEESTLIEYAPQSDSCGGKGKVKVQKRMKKSHLSKTKKLKFEF